MSALFKLASLVSVVVNQYSTRVKGKKYAYMKLVVKDGRVEVEVVEGRTTGAPEPNVRGRPEKAVCLFCDSAVTLYDPETGRVYSSEKDAKEKKVRERLVFYPKHALRDWNKRLDEYLDGRIGIDELRNALARPRILVNRPKGILALQDGEPSV